MLGFNKGGPTHPQGASGSQFVVIENVFLDGGHMEEQPHLKLSLRFQMKDDCSGDSVDSGCHESQAYLSQCIT